MIKRFNEPDEVRSTAVIYRSSFEQVKQIHAVDPQAAGELAISIIEAVITGQVSTDNPWIKASLANLLEASAKSASKYNARVDKAEERRKKSLDLEIIARLLGEGKTQAQIAKILGKSASTINARVQVLREQFPELLSKNSINSGNFSQFDEYSENSENSILDFSNFDENSINSTNSKIEDSNLGKYSVNSTNSILDFSNSNSNENSTIRVKFDEFGSNSENSKNSTNSTHVNVNVNDNVNNNETELPEISLGELQSMGAQYKYLSGGIIEFSTGVKMKLKNEF